MYKGERMEEEISMDEALLNTGCVCGSWFTEDTIDIIPDPKYDETVKSYEDIWPSPRNITIPAFYQRLLNRCPRCHYPQFTVHAREQPFQNQRFRRWEEREEVFLCAAVTERFYRCHSLSPSQDEKDIAKANNEGSDHIVWRKIRARVIEFINRYYEFTGIKTTVRSVEAIQKRWKLTGQARRELGTSNEECITEQLLNYWNEQYNANKLLSGPRADFDNFIRQLKHCNSCYCIA